MLEAPPEPARDASPSEDAAPEGGDDMRPERGLAEDAAAAGDALKGEADSSSSDVVSHPDGPVDGTLPDGPISDGSSSPPADVDANWPVDSGGPTTIVSAPGLHPLSFVVDELNVYWANSSEVFDCPVAGCPHDTLRPLAFAGRAGASSLFPQTVAVSGSTVYYLAVGGGIGDCAASGCALSGNTYEPGGDAAAPDGDTADGGEATGFSLLASDGLNVYFSDGSRLLQCGAAASCSAPKTLVTSAPGDTIGPVALSETEVYYGRSGSPAVFAVRIGGGAARKVCSGVKPHTGVASIAYAKKHVYFVYDSDPSIYACPSSGSGSANVYFTDVAPSGLSADSTRLYWANDVAPGDVVTCPLGVLCTNPSTVAAEQSKPSATAVNTKSVFWIASDGIYSVAK